MSSESSSGDREFLLFASRRSSRLHRPRGEDASLDAHPQRLRHHRRARPAPVAGATPAALLDSRFHQGPSDGGREALNLLAAQPEHGGVSGRHLVTMVSTLLPDWLSVVVLERSSGRQAPLDPGRVEFWIRRSGSPP